jgi:quercetin dioxygenase-like cupin family protein
MDGQLLLQSNDGEHVAELKAGQSYFREAGVEHNVINANDYEFYFVEVELR